MLKNLLSKSNVILKCISTDEFKKFAEAGFELLTFGLGDQCLTHYTKSGAK